MGRWTAPQIRQLATREVGSTSRKLAQPFVRQNGRPAAVLAAVARRRNRRMELARPMEFAVAVRDIMMIWISVLSGAPQAVSGLGGNPGLVRIPARDGGGCGVVVRAEYRERPLSRRSTGAVAAGR